MEVCLVGNPNCGKTTLFNTLTGSNQRVGNWSGVTVECKSGLMYCDQTMITVVDLPGIYTMTVASESQSLDEQAACEYILSHQADCIVNIIDASQLERSLFLSMQLRAANLPMIIVVNMLDVIERHGNYIQLDRIAELLQCPVLGISATKKRGLTELKQQLLKPLPQIKPLQLEKTVELTSLHEKLTAEFSMTSNPSWYAMQFIEGSLLAAHMLEKAVAEQCQNALVTFESTMQESADIAFARARYDAIETVIQTAVQQQSRQKKSPKFSEKIDAVVLNRWLGLPIFLVMMYVLFVFAINVGGIFQDFFDQMGQLIFIDSVAAVLQQLHLPNWFTAIFAAGIGRGFATTIAFIPIIGAMFLGLAFLESSGYMTRAAFVMDRVMRSVGLPGKSFVPLIIGFGCNVPAVLAARTLESRRDRVLTIMMSPFMSCGARLAIYAVFVAAFFPQGGQNIVFLLYLIGILMAVLTGLLLRKTALKGDASSLAMELPTYHWPSVKSLGFTTWFRLRAFLKRAVRIIVPLCLLLGFLNSMTLSGELHLGEGDRNSILSRIGQVAAPVVEPMGIQASNWPATVGLVTGMVAKEVVVGTLNTLYSQNIENTQVETDFHFWQQAKAALQTIPKKIIALPESLLNPIAASAPDADMMNNVYGQMVFQFGSQAAAFAYLLFLLLYFPCISTTAVMIKELNRTWTCFSVVWTTGLAYLTSVCFYQLATRHQHPGAAYTWLIAFVGFVIAAILFLQRQTTPTGGKGHVASSTCSKCVEMC